MAKAIVRIGYKDYVMDAADALKLVEVLSNTERYESKYHPNTKNYSYHVYQDDTENVSEIKIITDNHYRVAKAAGKSETK